ncbi:MAG: O-acetyl-ADP-ribose deacetylase [Clostridiales bacterium]|nr:MAG: O-acetyl-ADP-ribose deacetylase [Clostridiales bacterium]
MLKGDITDQNTQAIVNAANSSLLGGGGVDGAIHRAGGPEILEECKIFRKEFGKCPPGEAVMTTGGRLKADYVIHAVGPIWKDGNQNEPGILRDTYVNVLRIAAENHIRSIAFPAISTGVYRFPKEMAARIAMETTRDFIEETPIEEIRFILFGNQDFHVYENSYRNIFNLY